MSYNIEDEKIEMKIQETFLKENIESLKSTMKYCLQASDHESLRLASIVIKECQKKLDQVLTGEYFSLD